MIVVLQGGIEQLEQIFTKEDIAKAVQKIQSQTASSSSNDIQQNSSTVLGNVTKAMSYGSVIVNETHVDKQVNVSFVESKDGANNTQINANVNINVQFTQQTTVQINNSNVQIGPITIVQEVPKVVPQPIKTVETTPTSPPIVAPIIAPAETPAATSVQIVTPIQSTPITV